MYTKKFVLCRDLHAASLRKTSKVNNQFVCYVETYLSGSNAINFNHKYNATISHLHNQSAEQHTRNPSAWSGDQNFFCGPRPNLGHLRQPGTASQEHRLPWTTVNVVQITCKTSTNIQRYRILVSYLYRSKPTWQIGVHQARQSHFPSIKFISLQCHVISSS